MENLLKKLFGQSSAYALGKILTKGVGLLLLPLYTHYLSTDDYGILAVASMITGLLGTVLTGGARGAALKFYYEYDGIDRRRFYGSLSTTLVFGAGALFVLVDTYGETIFGLVFEEVPYHPYIRMALWTAYLTAVFLEVTKQLFKGAGQAFRYTGINIAVFTVSTLFTIWWVVFEGQGAEGAIRGKLVGAGIIGVGCAGYMMRYARRALDFSMIRQALLYSLPLVPHYLSHWVLSSADRFLLERMMTLSDVGVYNVGYKIGMGMSLFAIAGNNAIVPLFGNLNPTDEADMKQVSEVFTYYMAVILILGLFIALFGEELVVIATPPEYHLAGYVVPWVVLGYALMALYFFPTNLLTITEGQSQVVGIATTIGAAANIGLNVIFIPVIGIYGAAVTTTATYLMMFLGVYLIASQSCAVPVERRRLAMLFVAVFLTFGLGWIAAPDNIVGGILVKMGGLLAFPLILWAVGFFRDKEIQFVRQSIWEWGG